MSVSRPGALVEVLPIAFGGLQAVVGGLGRDRHEFAVGLVAEPLADLPVSPLKRTQSRDVGRGVSQNSRFRNVSPEFATPLAPIRKGRMVSLGFDNGDACEKRNDWRNFPASPASDLA